ncbi:hypothetical protein MRX96_040573 [Rhipicephalus microplus]
MAASTKTGYDPSTMQCVDIEVAETREDPIPGEGEYLQIMVHQLQEKLAKMKPRGSTAAAQPQARKRGSTPAACVESPRQLATWKPTHTPRIRSDELLRPPTLPAAAEPSPASPAGASGTRPADAPAAEHKEKPMSWSDADRGKKRRARRSPGPSKERLAAAPSGGPGSPKDDLPVLKRPAARESDEKSTSSTVTGSTAGELSNSSSCPNCGPDNSEFSVMSHTRYSSTNKDSLSEGDARFSFRFLSILVSVFCPIFHHGFFSHYCYL